MMGRASSNLAVPAQSGDNMGRYRNTGAKFTRADGTIIHRGVSFVPTVEELRARKYKLVLVEGLPFVEAPADPAPEYTPEAPTEEVIESPGPVADRAVVEQYHVGRGWYEVPGTPRKVRFDEASRLLA